MLRIGKIPYLVCAPYFFRTGPTAHFEYVEGHPSQLNGFLAAGVIDLAPSSSIEYAKGENYFILDGVCTSGEGSVGSVLFLSEQPIENLEGQEIYLTQNSATSIQLFKILANLWLKSPFTEVDSMEKCSGAVLIGNQALIEKKNPRWKYCYDLASLWYEWQKLPFVFGIWMVRSEAVQAKMPEIRKFRTLLMDNMNLFMSDPWFYSNIGWAPSEMNAEEVIAFFAQMSYAFNESKQKSLNLFFQLCFSSGYLDKIPEIRLI